MSFRVEDLIPHRGKMKLVAEMIEVTEDRCVTASVASPSWPLAAGGYVNPIVLIELVAQTAGVSYGWREMNRGGTSEGKVGWLVGIKHARFFCDRIPFGSRVIVTTETGKESGGYAEVHGTAEADGTRVADVVLQVFRPDGSSGVEM